MNFIRKIFIAIVIVILIILSISIYHSNTFTQNQILSYFITIDVTVIGFIITLIGIIAAIRNINIVDSYIKDHGNSFKNVLFFNVFSGMLTIILILVLISWIGVFVYDYLLIGILIFQGLFLISAMFIVINMLDMIFKESDNPIEEKDIYK
ncbi:hypothetical protein [Jeotgalicoccus sp. FSL K6-3177]|uniref:hypothetical protein n=1 Tax=Jeotgalicoccus sp. FSL K6-3177 TaxID=2921494 RepID=UPI0030FDD534